MPSQIDPTQFPDNVPVDKSDLRQQFQIAKDEITELQNNTTVVRRMFVNDLLWDNL